MHVKKLEKFCGYGGKLEKPWSSGDLTYATNGFTLIMVPRMKEVPEIKDTVNVQAVIDGNPEPLAGWVDAPGVAGLNVPECPKCKGKESESEECEECQGTGYVNLENDFHDYEWECKSCDGEGETDGCRECDGTGYLYKNAFVTIGGTEFKTGQILELTRTFGPLQIASPSPDASWVRFKGGKAIIMPIKRAKSA